jgi:hypothetical protein
MGYPREFGRNNSGKPGVNGSKIVQNYGLWRKTVCAAMPDSTADPALQTPDELYGVEGAAPRVNYLVHQVFCPAQNIPNYFKEQKYI